MPDPGYDPWDAVDDALDAGDDPTSAHDSARSDELTWRYAVSGGYRRAYLRTWERNRPPRNRAAYMRAYRARRKAAQKAALPD